MRFSDKLKILYNKYKFKDLIMINIIAALIRHGLTLGGGALLATSSIDDGTINTVAGAIVTLAGFGWSLLDKKLNK